ncbi:MAG: DUF456 domain-containing protein [Prevotella sp.]|nr:DUF456 domain-containing protein [Prevotella sp.]
MTIAIICLSYLLVGIGFLGCFIHKFPGPVTAFIGMLIFVFGTNIPVPWTGILMCAILLIITAICNKKVIPYITTKISEFGNGGKWGAVIGSLIGLLLIAGSGNQDNGMMVTALILGFVVLPLGLAFCGESISRKSISTAVKPATAAYLTYLLSMLLKIAVCCYCVYIMITNGQG